MLVSYGAHVESLHHQFLRSLCPRMSIHGLFARVISNCRSMPLPVVLGDVELVPTDQKFIMNICQVQLLVPTLHLT